MEKTIWHPLWEGSEVVWLAFKQCLSSCPTGGAACSSPLAPTLVASSLAMEPARPIQFVGVGSYYSAWPYVLFRWMVVQIWIPMLWTLSSISHHPTLMLTYCCPALTCGDPVDSPRTPKTVSKRGKVSIPNLCSLLPIYPPSESVKSSVRISSNLVSLSSSWAFRKTKIWQQFFGFWSIQQKKLIPGLVLKNHPSAHFLVYSFPRLL